MNPRDDYVTMPYGPGQPVDLEDFVENYFDKYSLEDVMEFKTWYDKNGGIIEFTEPLRKLIGQQIGKRLIGIWTEE